jgi:hypothetical protein
LFENTCDSDCFCCKAKTGQGSRAQNGNKVPELRIGERGARSTPREIVDERYRRENEKNFSEKISSKKLPRSVYAES